MGVGLEGFIGFGIRLWACKEGILGVGGTGCLVCLGWDRVLVRGCGLGMELGFGSFDCRMRDVGGE